MNNWRVSGWFRPPPLPWPILNSASVAPNRYQFCHRLDLSSPRPKGLSRERVVPLLPPVPQPPTHADELGICCHILAAVDRLADLSMRLEQFARPPPAIGIRELASVAAGRSW
jgi:hypothetical protein